MGEYASYVSGHAPQSVAVRIECQYEVMKTRPRDYKSALENAMPDNINEPKADASSAKDENDPRFIFNKTVILLVASDSSNLTFLFVSVGATRIHRVARLAQQGGGGNFMVDGLGMFHQLTVRRKFKHTDLSLFCSEISGYS